MDNRLSKFIDKIKNKKQTLHSLSAGFVFFVLLYVFTKVFGISVCPIKNIFEISCFGCGLTRGFIKILECDFKAATEYNVLSIPLFVGIFLYCVILLADIIFDNNYICKIEKQLAKKYMYIVYIAILVVSYIYNN